MESSAMLRRARMPARALKRLPPFLALALTAVIFDQVTKALVRDRLELGASWPEGWTLIRFTHVENTGAAFGIFEGGGDFLLVAPLIAIGAIAFFLLSPSASGRFESIALSLILGGAAGNWIDRVRLGAVTDFIDPTHYPAFNVADSCIVVGVATLLILSLFEGRSAPPDAGKPE